MIPNEINNEEANTEIASDDRAEESDIENSEYSNLNTNAIICCTCSLFNEY